MFSQGATRETPWVQHCSETVHWWHCFSNAQNHQARWRGKKKSRCRWTVSYRSKITLCNRNPNSAASIDCLVAALASDLQEPSRLFGSFNLASSLSPVSLLGPPVWFEDRQWKLNMLRNDRSDRTQTVLLVLVLVLLQLLDHPGRSHRPLRGTPSLLAVSVWPLRERLGQSIVTVTVNRYRLAQAVAVRECFMNVCRMFWQGALPRKFVNFKMQNDECHN